MLNEESLMNLARVTVFTLMLMNGATIPVRSLFSMQGNTALMLRSIIAAIVLVPGAVLVILLCFNLPIEVTTGMALLAAAPGAPLITQRSRIVAGNTSLAANLQLKLVLAAVLVTPLTLTLFKALLPLLPELASSPTSVAWEIAAVSLMPVCLGLLIQQYLPNTAERLGRPLHIVAQLLFLLLAALITWSAVKMTIQLGAVVALAIVLMAATALVLGHAISAGNPPNQRASVATACMARNMGLAVIIASADGIQGRLLPTFMAFMLLGMLAAVPYAAWMHRILRG
jgi:BASS family bile acid:Na+ symporter